MPPSTPAAPAPRKLGFADFARLPADALRHEILDGAHYTSPAPDASHQEALHQLLRLLDAHLDQTRAGRTFFAPYDVLLTPHDIAEPDLIFVARDRLDIVTPAHIVGAPDLLVEIFSPGTRDRDESLKRERYRHSGVTEYWMVDTHARSVRVVPWSPPFEVVLTGSDVLTTPLLPGFTVPVARIFENANPPAP